MKEIEIISSKSDAHRALIGSTLALLTGGSVPEVIYRGSSGDIEATEECLREIERVWEGGCSDIARLRCGESGSTLRFLLPLVGALGVEAEFLLEGRLPMRPLSPLYEELQAHGQNLEGGGSPHIKSKGKLTPGDYEIPGNISSQYITGLLMALPILDGDSRLKVGGIMESSGYVEMTLKMLTAFEVEADGKDAGGGREFHIKGNQIYSRTEDYVVEGDWSNGAFWLVAGAIGDEAVRVKGLDTRSAQGDRAILDVLKNFGAEVEVHERELTVYPGTLEGCTIDGSQIPDLVPIIALLAAASKGKSRIVNAGRLRDKESDRLKSVTALLRNLGGDVREEEDGLTIVGGKPLKGGEVDSYNDHRIAMTAAICSLITEEPVEIWGSRAVKKSYPDFYDVFRKNFEDNIITR